MPHDRTESQGYWDRADVESMYDKHLLRLEIALLSAHIPPGSRILDAGCGEGEGTREYAAIPSVRIHAVDFSTTRLRMAAERLRDRDNVVLSRVDFLDEYSLEGDYDVVVSQRFLINLTEWTLQKKVMSALIGLLKPGGSLLMLEGSQQGAEELNSLRAAFGLPPIPVKWHNHFVSDEALAGFVNEQGCVIELRAGFGAYFALTRGIRPVLDRDLQWDCEFNRIAATSTVEGLLGLGTRFSRLRLWVIRRAAS